MAKSITIKAERPDDQAIVAAFQHWCRQHDMPVRGFFLAIMPKILFCLRNYTRVDSLGQPIVTLNLAETTIPTYVTTNRRPDKPKRKKWDSAF